MKTKLNLLLGLLFFLMAPLMAQTNVSGTIASNTTWAAANSPYIVVASVTVNSGVTLTVESGVIVKFNDNLGLTINGTLNATEATFTSSNASPSPGIWSTITINGTADFNNCQIQYGNYILQNASSTLTTSNGTSITSMNSYGIYVNANATLNASNTFISGAINHGVVTVGVANVNLSDVTVSNIENRAVLLSGGTIANLHNVNFSSTNEPLHFAGSAEVTATGNNTLAGTRILVSFGYSQSDTKLPNFNIPYYFNANSNIQAGHSLTIESGAIVQFNDNTGLYINGNLSASNVQFTSSSNSPSPGIWNAITVNGIATLDNCQVQYGNNIILNDGSSLTTSNGTSISNMGAHGIYLNANANLDASNTSITGASNHGIVAAGAANISLTDVTISDIDNRALYLAGGTVADVHNINLSSVNEAIHYAGSAVVNASGTNVLSGTRILVSFGYSTSNTKLPKFNVPYYFNNNTIIQADDSLTIASDVILKFAGVHLTVHGTMNAQANLGEKIYFTTIYDDNLAGDTNQDGTNTGPSVGNWAGVRLVGAESNSSILKRCYFRFSGNGGAVNFSGSDATLDSSEFYNNYFGIYLNNASSPTLRYNTIGSSSITPLALTFDSDPILVDNVLSFSDNQYDAIALVGSVIIRDAVVKKRDFTDIPNITYLLIDNVTVPSGFSLTIEPGVVIKSESGYNFYIDGELQMNGTAEEPIVLTSARDDNEGNPADTNKNGTITTPTTGQMGSIIFTPGSTGSITYSRIKYAQGPWYSYYIYNQYITLAAINVVNTTVAISNNQLRNTNYGIMCYKASNPTIANNDFENISYTPVAISSSANPTFTGNTMTNVGLNAIGIIGEDVTLNGTISKRNFAGINNITYVLLSSITIKNETNVTVEPGVVIKVNPSQSIYVEGGFKVSGTLLEPIVFTSIYDDNFGNPFDTNGDGNATTPSYNNWDAIFYQATSDDVFSTVTHTRVKFANQSIYLTSANTPINFVRLSNNGYGLTTDGNASPLVDNLIVENSYNDPLRMSLTSDPTYTNITLAANGTTGIRIIEGTLSSNATLRKRDLAGIQNIAYRVGQLTVASGSTLTIEPGVVMKLYSYEYITINGTLIADGTDSQKIIFTSLNDDSAGGDTNNNGNETVPTRSDWVGIWFEESAGNSLNYCEFRYASNIWWYGTQNEGVVRFNNSGGTFQNSVIQQSNSNGLSIFGSSDPHILNNQLYNIAGAPVHMSMFSNPTFSGNTMTNMGNYALSIITETYNQSDTVPVRNFGGNNNISYYFGGSSTISAGTTLTIPAGITFKSTSGVFVVDGMLNILGTENEPVVFTSLQDDSYGNPNDTEGNGNQPSNNQYSEMIIFNDISDDASVIEHTIFRNSNNSIRLNSASPTINNNLFQKGGLGIYLSGTSAPVITNNTFDNLTDAAPFATSIITYPLQSEGNTISGSTMGAIRIIDETLTQDATLPKRDFGGITNIPYVFQYYTVGTSSVLTIEAGVVCKFDDYGTLTVQKGLIAEGTIEEPIVFTHISDDFYGGDTDKDREYPWYGFHWRGIYIPNDAIDASTRFNHVILKNADNYGYYANGAFNLTSSSPTITNTVIDNWYHGIVLSGASNPVINQNSFGEVHPDNGYAINNTDLTFTVNAENNWWNDPTGPEHSDNPNGVGARVTDGVDYNPFQTLVANPEMGDVSQNGKIQAFDASLILKSVVSAITLTPTQERVADVSGNGTIMAMDASYVLQYTVGMIGGFEGLDGSRLASSGGSLELISQGFDEFNRVVIPIKVNLDKPMYALQASINYDPQVLSFVTAEKAEGLQDLEFSYYNNHNQLNMALAGIYANDYNGEYIYLTFQLNTLGGKGLSNTKLSLTEAVINESDVLSTSTGAVNLDISGRVLSALSGLEASTKMYPNPVNGILHLQYHVDGISENVKIEVFDILGQTHITIVDEVQTSGTKMIDWDAAKLSTGMYILKISAGTQSVSHKLMVE